MSVLNSFSNVTDHPNQFIVFEISKNSLIGYFLFEYSLFMAKSVDMNNDYLTIWRYYTSISTLLFSTFSTLIIFQILGNWELKNFGMRYCMDVLVLNINDLIITILAFIYIFAINLENIFKIREKWSIFACLILHGLNKLN